METFVPEDSLSCPHFTDNETEALQGHDWLDVHSAHQDRPLAIRSVETSSGHFQLWKKQPSGTRVSAES